MSKTIEQIYQKKSQLEHILLRPDSYIGSTEIQSQSLWILNDQNEKFTHKEIEFSPGLYKIFDEILVNAADNFQRDQRMNLIKINIDPVNNRISIWNNGQGIPVQVHKEHKMYVPELIFGHLLTGSNYDDTQKRVVGGRNGYGAKLTNIFSKTFELEAADCKNMRVFKKLWKNNMMESDSEIVKSYSGQEDFTCVTFQPDLKLFHMENISKDMINLLKKRAYDIAGIFNGKVKVQLNGKMLKIRDFMSYVNFYFENEDTPKIYDKAMKSDRWEILVAFSDGQFEQVSFVNSICTSNGGTHVNSIVDRIVDKISQQLQKKHKNLNFKPYQIKQNLFLFVNCLIENPTFDSQTKEYMSLKPSQFGSKCELSEKFIKDLLKSGIVESIAIQAKAKEESQMAKKLAGGKKQRLVGIPKLEDANHAGTRNGESCTLILTEGDSAKSLAMAGLEIIGRDKYGVFPLRGKFLNVRESASKQIMENQEVQNLIKILALQIKKDYNDVKSLRYGSIMIMADQDHDGSHIKGLIINFIHYFWPSLIQKLNFLKEFATPIVKATQGSQQLSFFTLSDFDKWKSGINIKQWKIKYYKGLGTSTNKEAQEYFSNLQKHQIKFLYQNQQDDEAIDLVFNKKKADARKEWLKSYDPDIGIDHDQSHMTYKDFVNKELIHFSISDNQRSIPSICDGFKPGQRKILFACFKRNLKNEIKVAQLQGYVAEHSAYHHGEMSLAQTIIGMAQNFVGSNNINLLLPIGQFGTRNLGGRDHASARYIYTSLSPITRFLFIEHDDHLYKYLEDDGQKVEPSYYLPIIPLILVNGCEGIGTGWSTSIPCYNPREIVQSIKKKLQGGQFEDLVPWFKGYQGDIIENPKGGYIINGKFDADEEEDQLDITELPLRRWTTPYKQFLEEMLAPEKGDPIITDVRQYHTTNRVHFQIDCAQNLIKTLNQGEGIDKKFKLSTSFQTSNLVLFNSRGQLQKYSNVVEILEEFFILRLEFYGKRKQYLRSKIQRDIQILDQKVKFILAVINDEIQLKAVKKQIIVEQLQRMGFIPESKFKQIQSTKLAQTGLYQSNENNEEEDLNQDEQSQSEEQKELNRKSQDYNYLLGMALWSLTYEKIEDLKKQLQSKNLELQELENQTIEQLWIQDLDFFVKKLDEIEYLEEQQRLKGPQGKSEGIGKKRRANNNQKKNVQEKQKDAKQGKKQQKENIQKSIQNEQNQNNQKDQKQVTSTKDVIDPKVQEEQYQFLPLNERLKLKEQQSGTTSSIFLKDGQNNQKENLKDLLKQQETQQKQQKKNQQQMDQFIIKKPRKKFKKNNSESEDEEDLQQFLEENQNQKVEILQNRPKRQKQYQSIDYRIDESSSSDNKGNNDESYEEIYF